MTGLETFFSFPWQGVLGFLGVLILIGIWLPKVGPKLQRPLQTILGVRAAVMEALEIMETRVEERHKETTDRLDAICDNIAKATAERAHLSEQIEDHQHRAEDHQHRGYGEKESNQ